MTDLRNRIVEMRVVHSSELRDNEGNWRVHPAVQREALGGILAQIGIADALLAYSSERAGGQLVLIDGHLRAEEFPGDWPVNVLDVTDDEADLLLATHDPLAAMAEMAGGQLSGLLDTIPQPDEEGLQRLMADLETQAGLASLMDDTPSFAFWRWEMVNRVKLVLEQPEYSALLKVARAELRTLDAQARHILRQELERRGLLPPPDQQAHTVRAELEGQATGDWGGAGEGALDRLHRKSHQVTPVIDLDDLPVFERAVRATGLANRGLAVIEICKHYLFTHGSRSHGDVPGGSDGAE